MVDLHLGLGDVLRGPPHVVEHSEGISGLVEMVNSSVVGRSSPFT